MKVKKATKLVLVGIFLFLIEAKVLFSKEVEIESITCPSTIVIGKFDKKGNFLGTETLSFEKYIKGVVYGELWHAEGWGENSPIEALKAQAVTARSYAIYLKDVQKRHKGDGYDLCNRQHCQVWKPEPVGGYPLKVTTATTNTSGIGTTYNESNINTTFFSSTKYKAGHIYYTKNAEEAPDFGGFYSYYLRKTVSPEGPVGAGGHGAGMSQYGAKHLAEMGKSYQEILKHYYGPVPPYVKRIRVTQGKTEYIGKWIDNDDYNTHDNPNPTRKLDKPAEVVRFNEKSNIDIEIEYSEQMRDVKLLVGAVEVPIKLITSEKEAYRKAIGTITKEMIEANKIYGRQVLKLSGRHKYVQEWELDKDPKSFSHQHYYEGYFVNYEPGIDENHEIIVGTELIAVTDPGYDNIGAILTNMGRSFTEIQDSQLADYNFIKQFKNIFINQSYPRQLHNRKIEKK